MEGHTGMITTSRRLYLVIGTPYEGGSWKVELIISSTYPMTPPKVCLHALGPVLSPYVGEICYTYLAL